MGGQRSVQVLNFLVEYKGRFVPVIHVVMASRKLGLYTRVMARIRELFPNLLPEHIMSDFELALRKALRIAWESATLHGCRFHFAKALHSRIKNKLGLVSYYRPGSKSDRLRKLSHTLRCYMSLPLLSPEDIRKEVPRLQDELRTAEVRHLRESL